MLVHGAWHGAWCFERVLPLLAAAGVDAVAIDLPGHGDHPGPFTDLLGDASAVEAELDALAAAGRADDGIVLLGHSYGGAVVTQAGVHPAVGQLVYLCAFALDDGESVASAAPAEASALSHEGRPDLSQAMVVDDDGVSTLPPDGAAECFYNLCDEATVAWAVGRLGGQPLANLVAGPTRIAWRERPATYVVCSEDLAVHPGLQRILAARCASSVEWPVGHSPFASHPRLLADLLIDLAVAPGAGTGR